MVAPRPWDRSPDHSEAGRSAFPRRPTSLSTPELRRGGENIMHMRGLFRQRYDAYRIVVRGGARGARTAARLGGWAGWHISRLGRAVSVALRDEESSRCARCQPVCAASRRPPALEEPPRSVAWPTQAQHTACSMKCTFSHPARPSSQVSNRRSFWRLGAGGGCQKRGSGGSGCCGG